MTARFPLPRVGGEPPLQAVLFDAGLTLIRAATPAESVAAEALEGCGQSATWSELHHVMESAQANLEGRWHRGNWWVAEAKVRDLFTSAYRVGLADLPCVHGDADLADRLADAIYDAYQDTRHWALYDDVLPTLDALRVAGVAMAIVSDWGHGLEAIVRELELGDYLAGLVVSSRLGMSKPHSGVFETALDRVGARPESALYVGDTYVKDVLGARAAGVAAVLLDRAGKAPAMDCAVVRRLDELMALVGA